MSGNRVALVARTQKLFGPVAWLIVAGVLAEWWSRLAHAEFPHPQYSNADLLYAATLYEDVQVWGGSYREWHLTPAPYFFPDLALYWGLRPLLMSIELACCLTAMALAVGIIFAGRWCVPKGPTRAAVGALLGGSVAAGIAWPGSEWSQLLLLTYHSGVVVCGFLATALVFGSRGLGGWRWVALGGVCLLATASDLLFLSGFGVPVLTLGLLGAWRRSRVFPPLVPSLIAGTSSLLGLVVARRMVPFPQRGLGRVELERLTSTVQQMVVDWSGFSLSLRACMLAGAVATLVALLRKPRDERTAAICVLWLVGGCGTLLSILVTGSLVDSAWSRYLLWPALSGVVGVALVLGDGRFSKPIAAGLLLASLAASCLVVQPLKWTLRPPALASERVAAGCLDTLSAAEGTKVGLSDYWHAKPLSLFSQAGVRLLQFTPDLKSPYLGIATRTWFYRVDETGFVVLDGLEREAVERDFGPPDHEMRCEGLTLWVYRGERRSRLARVLRGRLEAALGHW